MEWNNTGIATAIQKAKSLNALFVVVIHGGDENSNLFLDLMNDPEVTSLLSQDHCVALKLEHESEGYKQFNDLYPVILVPSVYFIDSSNGVDVEVTGGLQMTKDRLVQSIKKALAAAKVIPAESAANVENVLSPRAVRVEEARDVIRQTWDTMKENMENTDSKTSNTDDQETPSSSNVNVGTLSLEERVSRAKQLLASRREKEQEEIEEKDKSSEKERRDMGKKMQEFKKTQEEKDALKAAEERRKDREETKLARKRVKAQIEQDRLEKQAKFEIQKQQDMKERKQKT